MKRVLFFSSFCLLAFINFSCRKDFTCTCSKIYKNNTGDNIRDYSRTTYRDSRSGAENKCQAENVKGTDETGDYTMNCVIDC
jgi:hypothetical protein